MTNSIALARAVAPIETLSDIPRYHATLTPNAAALSFEGRETTYGGLNDASNQVASGLIAGSVKPTRRIAILDKNSDMFFFGSFWRSQGERSARTQQCAAYRNDRVITALSRG